MLHYSLEEAKEFKQKNENLIGLILNPVNLPLLKLIIIQKTPGEFGSMWANQREAFDDEDNSKIISDEEFNKQLNNFDTLDLAKVDGQFYYVVGVFRFPNGEPYFQPLNTLLSYNVR